VPNPTAETVLPPGCNQGIQLIMLAQYYATPDGIEEPSGKQGKSVEQVNGEW